MGNSRPSVELANRLADRTRIDASTGCWVWQGRPNYIGGYGRMSFAGRQAYAHRLSYEAHRGAIPDGMEIDHLCRNRMCINPSHLECVTGRVNTRRGFGPSGVNGRKTHCKHGHEFTPENTRIRRSGWRACRECERYAPSTRRL